MSELAVDGDEADGASPADTLDVEMRDFFGVNEADRAGEADYGGYDFPPYAAAIATPGAPSCAGASSAPCRPTSRLLRVRPRSTLRDSDVADMMTR